MNLARSLGVSTAILAALPPAMAHHSPAAFDEETVANLDGTVTRFDFKNPHVYIYLESTDESGNRIEWEVESDWTTELRRLGWTERSLQPGDRIAAQVHPARNPRRHYANLILLTKEDGSVLTSWDLRPEQAAPPPARAESITGRWLPEPGFLQFFELAAELANEDGRAALAAFSEVDSPGAECVPHPLPQRLGHPHVNDIEVLDDRVVITAESEAEPRVVYLDGRGHPEDFQPTSRGHSIGEWQDGVLVVETVHFAAHRSGNGFGLPSGAGKRLTERYRLAEDGTRLYVDYVLEDPEYLTEPVSGTFAWQYAPHMERVPYTCDSEVASRYIEEAEDR